MTEDVKRILDRTAREYNFASGVARIVREGRPEDQNEMNGLLEAAKYFGHRMTPNFVIDRENVNAYTQAIRWLAGFNTFDGDLTKGLYICGNTGSGKSVLARVLFLLSASCEYQYRLTSQDEKLTLRIAVVSESEIMRSFQKYGDIGQFRQNVLCIDDIGSETQAVNYFGTRVSPIRELLEYRCDNRCLFTIVTSNYPLYDDTNNTLLNLYGERALSRLKGSMNCVELVGTDRRIAK